MQQASFLHKEMLENSLFLYRPRSFCVIIAVKKVIVEKKLNAVI